MKKFLLLCFLMSALVSCSDDYKEYNVFSIVYGVVSDLETGDPVAGANVLLSPGGNTKITGSDGWFEFKDLEPQQYTVTVQKTGYSTNRKSVNAVSGESTELNITLTKQ